jgi:anti-sigma regulatory factor (Ser/Thr protein kinase)
VIPEPSHQSVALDEPVGAVELTLAEEEPIARIRLPARESGVAVARQFVAGMSSLLQVSRHTSEDLKLAATEACTNAVLHAYPNGSAGPVELELRVDGEHLVLVVRDGGSGPPVDIDFDDEAEGGYGLELMHAVSDELEVEGAPGSGTEVRMAFHLGRGVAHDAHDAVHSPVLRRVVAMMAAHVGFTMDRLSDAVLVAETLAAHTPSHTVNGVVRVIVEDRESGVMLRVGPLVDGGASRLLADSRLPAYGGVLEHLADEVAAEAPNGGEFLIVRLAPRH